jgi:hypothetical protein
MTGSHSGSEPARRRETEAGSHSGMLERRSAERHECNVQTEGYQLGSHSNKTWVATVTNISATGVALMLRHRVKSGTVLVIKFQSGNLNLSRPIPVRVMHVQPQGEGTWLHGCAFVRKVREEDLQSLL